MKIIIMLSTVEWLAKQNPQFKFQPPKRVEETKSGIKYLVYE